jgi:hypothetical protein
MICFSSSHFRENRVSFLQYTRKEISEMFEYSSLYSQHGKVKAQLTYPEVGGSVVASTAAPIILQAIKKYPASKSRSHIFSCSLPSEALIESSSELQP